MEEFERDLVIVYTYVKGGKQSFFGGGVLDTDMYVWI